MKKEDLFKAIGEIDDDLIENSEKTHPKKKGKLIPFLSAAAACVVIVASAALILPRTAGGGFTLTSDSAVTTTGADTRTIEETTQETVTEESSAAATEATEGNFSEQGTNEGIRNWNVIYNVLDDAVILASDRLPGFTEELSDTELKAITPAMWYDWMDFSGKAEFSYLDGNLVFISLNVTGRDGRNILVTVSEFENFGDCIVEVHSDADKTDINGTEYTVCQHSFSDEELYLWATSEVNGVHLRFELTVHPDDVTAAKEDFEATLECFASYAEGFPKLELVTPEVIPEYINEELSLASARENPDFGAYMPSSIPEGYTEESIHYSKWGDVHSLSGLWCRGLSDLHWHISYYDESYSDNIVHPDETVKYDYGLYPIPRGESVPDELMETVYEPVFLLDEINLDAIKHRSYTPQEAGDDNALRIDFSVKCGDALIRISTEGVEPQWIYDRLMELK